MLLVACDFTTIIPRPRGFFSFSVPSRFPCADVFSLIQQPGAKLPVPLSSGLFLSFITTKDYAGKAQAVHGGNVYGDIRRTAAVAIRAIIEPSVSTRPRGRRDRVVDLELGNSDGPGGVAVREAWCKTSVTVPQASVGPARTCTPLLMSLLLYSSRSFPARMSTTFRR